MDPVGCFAMPAGMNYCYLHPLLKNVRARWAAWVHRHYADAAELHRAWDDFPLAGETFEHPEPPRTDAPYDPRLLDYHAFRNDEARRWVSLLRNAVRAHDDRHLLTVGLTPENVVPLDGDPLTPVFSSFSPTFALGDLIDFVSLHLYPGWAGAGGEDAETTNLAWQELTLSLARAELDRPPVLVEEYLALGPGVSDWAGWFDAVMAVSEPWAAGWMSFYHPLLYDGTESPWPPEVRHQYERWFDRFRTTAARVRDPDYRLPTAKPTRTFQLDREAVLTSGSARQRAFDDYLTTRSRSSKPPAVRWRPDR